MRSGISLALFQVSFELLSNPLILKHKCSTAFKPTLLLLGERHEMWTLKQREGWVFFHFEEESYL